MKDYRKLLWLVFSNTGDINDYLKYKLIENEALKIEVGEDFGFDKDNGNSNQNHQVW
jgi:hypothetical protein